MKIVRIDNHAYYGSVVGIIISGISILIGIVSRLPIPFILGLGLLIPCIYFINRYRKYRLELARDKIKEVTQKGVEEVTFKEIRQLDCEVIKYPDTLLLYPIFTLVKEDHSEIEYKVNNQASLFDIAAWVRINFPSARFTENVEKFITKPRAKWFFGSKKF